MAYGNRWTRRLGGAALTLAALAVAACSAGGSGSVGGDGSAGGAALPAGGGGTGGAAASSADASGTEVTKAEAQRVFDSYVAVMAKATRTGDGTLALSAVTGVRRAAVATTIKENRYFSGKPPLPFDENVYGTPAFYLPEQGGYPHWFVASVPGTSARAAGVRGAVSAGPYQPWAAGPGPRLTGTALLLFEQSAAGDPWKLASSSVLDSGATLPALARDSAGYIPAVKLSDASVLARPDVTGPLQAAVVDDGPASVASRAVAAGPLTTGMYDAARGYAAGLRPPPGDLYQWHLEGANLAKFAFRTADGGALVFYAMYLNTVIAVPAYLNKGYPVNPGPVIRYTPDLSPWLSGAPAPRISLERQDLLSFAAIDPPASGGTAKVQVIAGGGTLNYATAS